MHLNESSRSPCHYFMVSKVGTRNSRNTTPKSQVMGSYQGRISLELLYLQNSFLSFKCYCSISSKLSWGAAVFDTHSPEGSSSSISSELSWGAAVFDTH